MLAVYKRRQKIEFLHENPNSEILESGFLKIKANICKEGVYSFEGKELGINKELVNVWYPYREFANSKFFNDLKSVPIVEGHKEVSAENSQDIVGHVIGEPELNNGGVFVDLLIENKNVIEKIQNKEIQDVSLLFKAKSIPEEGEFEGRDFDCKIKDVTLEQIALLPPGEGRMGKEVRILNKRSMKMEEKTKEIDEKIARLEKAIADITEENSKLKEENLALTKKSSDAALEEKLSEAAEDNKKAEIVDAISETKIANSGLFGNKLYRATLNSLGINTQNMNEEQLKTAFETATFVAAKLKRTDSTEQNCVFSNRKSVLMENVSPMIPDDTCEKRLSGIKTQEQLNKKKC